MENNVGDIIIDIDNEGEFLKEATSKKVYKEQIHMEETYPENKEGLVEPLDVREYKEQAEINVVGLNFDGQHFISEKEKKVALILCLCLGIFGAHRFYVGKTKSAILYLCTLGLFGVGIVADLANIYLGNFKDNNEYILKY